MHLVSLCALPCREILEKNVFRTNHARTMSAQQAPGISATQTIQHFRITNLCLELVLYYDPVTIFGHYPEIVY